MKSLYFLVLSGFLITGCTVYRSEGRKQFESAAPTTVSVSSYKLMGCNSNDNTSSSQFENVLAENFELLHAQDGLTLWHHPLTESLVEIKARQQTDERTVECLFQFPDENTWQAVKAPFIEELSSRWMM